jgi:hypothetical protein
MPRFAVSAYHAALAAERPRSAAGADTPQTSAPATSPHTTTVPPSAVGRDKARYLAVRLLIPPWSPCMRLSPHPAAACQNLDPRFLPDDIRRDSHALPYHSAGSYFEAPDTRWPFTLGAAFPHADDYGHADG